MDGWVGGWVAISWGGLAGWWVAACGRAACTHATRCAPRCSPSPRLCAPPPVVLDGEAVAVDREAGKILPFQARTCAVHKGGGDCGRPRGHARQVAGRGTSSFATALLLLFENPSRATPTPLPPTRQVLSTRARKDVAMASIKVSVCVYIFDCLYVNGRCASPPRLTPARRAPGGGSGGQLTAVHPQRTALNPPHTPP